MTASSSGSVATSSVERSGRGASEHAVEADRDAALTQRLDLLGLRHRMQDDLDRGIVVAESEEQLRNRVEDAGAEDRDVEPSELALPRALGAFRSLFDDGADVARFLEKQFPGLREFHPLGGAREQPYAEFFFQLLDLPCERWLRDVQARGCAADVLLLGHGDEVSKVSQVHVMPGCVAGRMRSVRYLEGIDDAN